MTILIKNAYILTFDENQTVIPEGYILIKDNIIQEVQAGSYNGITPDTTIDANHRVVTPGLVNAHMHCYSTFSRGLDIGCAPSCFVEILEKLWWRLDKKLSTKDLYYSTLIPTMEAIRGGVTTFIDHHASPHCIPGCLDEVERALLDAGMRGILCYETSDRDGLEIAQQGIEENTRFIQKNNNNKDVLVKGTYGLHASFTVSDNTLQQTIDNANQNNVGIHIHLAEDHADQTLTLTQYKKRLVHRLSDRKALNDKSITAHAVWVDENEKDILANSPAWVVHNPRSNMNNAVGVMDLLGLIQRNAKVCLGTDGMCGSIWPDLRTVAILQKLQHRDPRLVWNELWTLLKNNYQLANIFFPIPQGQLQKNHLADIVIFNYYPPTPLTQNNILGHFLFGFAHVQAHTVLINGKIVLQNYEFLHLDEKEIAAKSREQAIDFAKRF
ncbi:MAG TPA: putative aminohydrolase SsnA [Planctomycetota bacterium]|nr:putative aminohydrolase SsnA [Planctomycetota bacterium]